MIKINVIVKNKFWMQRIAKPEIYFVKKVNKLNLKNKYFNKKISFFKRAKTYIRTNKRVLSSSS